MTASGFRVQVTGLVFVFNLASLVLKQVPTCTQKPKTNTFDLIRYKKKLKDVDIFCLRSDDDIQGRNDMTTGSQNDWRQVGSEKEKFLYHRISVHATDLCIV